MLARLFDSLDESAIGQVADATDTSTSQVSDRVEAALDTGDLVEQGAGETFPR